MSNIRFARYEDVDNIMKFIHNNWKENHILSRNKDFFLYEHKDENRINYVISHDNDGNLNGCLGFIKSSALNSDICTVIWKALKDSKTPMLGIELFEYLRRHKEYKTLVGIGANEKTLPIYNYLKIFTNHLNQYVILNNKLNHFKIAKITDNKYLQQKKFLHNDDYNIKQIEKNELVFNFEKYKNNIPYKDKKYFIKRYFNHPIYKYEIYGIFKNKKLNSLLVARVVRIENSKVLRIVDYIGQEEDIQFITKYLYEIIDKNEYEYVDFMCYGFNDIILQRSGFTKIDLESSELIVPNYFAPFIQKNIKIYFYADTLEIERIKICKADGDQDRPSDEL